MASGHLGIDPKIVRHRVKGRAVIRVEVEGVVVIGPMAQTEKTRWWRRNQKNHLKTHSSSWIRRGYLMSTITRWDQRVEVFRKGECSRVEDRVEWREVGAIEYRK